MSPRPEHPDAAVPTGERLQKVLAAAGVGSRRVCEDLIAAGRVEVDGATVRQMGTRVDPRSVVVKVDGLRVLLDEDLVHLALNKPRGVLTAMSDDRGRPTVGDLVADLSTRVFHVGRLDADTEGLLLVTNDGELSNRLMHPSYGVEKTYLAEVRGPFKPATRRWMLDGVELDDGPVTVHGVRVVERLGDALHLEVVLHEGRKHVVRRLLEEVGHPVSRLVRTQLGPIRLGSLRAGRRRTLNRTEVGQLYQTVGL